MDTRTGELVDMKFYNELIDSGDPQAKWYKEIPHSLLGELYGMNRKQRRQWYRDNKKRIKEMNNEPTP